MAILSIGELLGMGPSELSGLVPYSSLEYSGAVITGISGSAIGGQGGGSDPSAISAIASAYAESAASSKVDTTAFNDCCSAVDSALSGISGAVSAVTGKTGNYIDWSSSGAFQPSGNYQTAGDYAFNSALTAYQPIGDYAFNSSISGKQDASGMSAYATTGDLSSKLDASSINFDGDSSHVTGISGVPLSAQGGGVSFPMDIYVQNSASGILTTGVGTRTNSRDYYGASTPALIISACADPFWPGENGHQGYPSFIAVSDSASGIGPGNPEYPFCSAAYGSNGLRMTIGTAFWYDGSELTIDDSGISYAHMVSGTSVNSWHFGLTEYNLLSALSATGTGGGDCKIVYDASGNIYNSGAGNSLSTWHPGSVIYGSANSAMIDGVIVGLGNTAAAEVVIGKNNSARASGTVVGCRNRVPADTFPSFIFGDDNTAHKGDVIVGRNNDGHCILGSNNTGYISIGEWNSAGGTDISIGYRCSGGSQSSIAIGNGVLTTNNQIGIGNWNIDGTSDAFVIGDGNGSAKRHNLMEVKKDGEIVTYSSTADTTGLPIIATLRAISARATGDYVEKSALNVNIGSGNTSTVGSFVAGVGNSASGSVDFELLTFAYGSENTAEPGGVAFGWGNIASAYDFVQGSGNSAFNNNVFAQGCGNYGNVTCFAQGLENSAVDDGFAQGEYNSASGYSFSQGSNNRASSYSFAQGTDNSASTYSFAQGTGNKASYDSFAQGDHNSALYDSLAQGDHNTASDHSFAQGTGNSAYADSLAQGSRNTATGYSFAQGSSNSATNTAVVFGKNNLRGDGNTYTGDSAAFAIGDGTSTAARHDLLLVTKDGEIRTYSSTADTTGLPIIATLRAISAWATANGWTGM